MSELISIKSHNKFIQNLKVKGLLNNSLLEKDVWHTVEDLGLKTDEYYRIFRIKFDKIPQEELKILVKLYILLRVKQGKRIQTIISDIFYLKEFSLFLKERSIDRLEEIDNTAFEGFEDYLRSERYAEGTISCYLKSLKTFLDTCRLENWLDINTYWFKGKHTFHAKPENESIRYIPEEVWNQLDENLNQLPEPIQRMVLVIRTTGIRVGELATLPFDCLRKRGNQWRIRFTTEKYNTDDELPISAELAVLIQEQQEYIRKTFGGTYNYLFCSNQSGGDKKAWNQFTPQPRVMSRGTFNRWLNRLAQEANICSKENQLWHFTSHQFRRTVSTVMTNAGIRDLIIQKYLRHRSLDMQDYYKHLLKQVLGEEYQELIKEKKYVDITGKVIATYKPSNPITELMRRKMYQVTTQYGECHRPILKAPCQTVNACWRCQHWQTSVDDLFYLKEDLKRVGEELKLAEDLGMNRQKQGLEEDWNFLLTRIEGLEDSNDRS